MPPQLALNEGASGQGAPPSSKMKYPPPFTTGQARDQAKRVPALPRPCRSPRSQMAKLHCHGQTPRGEATLAGCPFLWGDCLRLGSDASWFVHGPTGRSWMVPWDRKRAGRPSTSSPPVRTQATTSDNPVFSMGPTAPITTVLSGGEMEEELPHDDTIPRMARSYHARGHGRCRGRRGPLLPLYALADPLGRE